MKWRNEPIFLRAARLRYFVRAHRHPIPRLFLVLHLRLIYHGFDSAVHAGSLPGPPRLRPKAC